MLLLIAGLGISLIFAIFFSGIEVAFLTANQVEIELKERQGSASGRLMGFFAEHPTWFIGTTLTGNLACVVFFAIFSTGLLSLASGPAASPFWVLPVSVLLSLAILYTVEFSSKGIFVINANKVLAWLAIPFTFFAILLFPIVYALVTIVKLVATSLLNVEYSHQKPVFGLTNVNVYLQTIHRLRRDEENIEVEKKILSNAIDFKSVRVHECMIPRTEIVAVPIVSSIKELQDAFISSGHSKIIVYRDSIDDIIGYCHSSALFKKPGKIDDILTPILSVPESTLASELMVRLINERKSVAVVLDEFGGTSGMVSMEDVIEEIFGEIEDEHDEDHLTEQMLNDHTYLLSARLEIDYLNETYNWGLPTGDYETLGGLILEHVRDIPKPGETVEIKPYTFIVQATEEARINTVKMVIDKNHQKA